MPLTTKRTVLTIGAVGTAAITAVATAPGAHAEVWTLKHTATVSTTIKAMNDTLTTTGNQNAQYDLEKGTLTANLALKDATSPVKIAGLPLAKATIAIEPTGPAKGTVDGKNNVKVTQKLNIHVKRIDPLGLPVNLVGNSCKTSTPVTMNLTGKLGGLFDPLLLKSTFSIPEFADCGLSTAIVSKMVSGEGNTVSINLKPAA